MLDKKEEVSRRAFEKRARQAFAKEFSKLFNSKRWREADWEAWDRGTNVTYTKEKK